LEEGAVRGFELDEQCDVRMAIELNIYIRTADWLLARRVCYRADPVGQLLQPLEMLIGENTGSAGKNF
jgi:hypothetical protein